MRASSWTSCRCHSKLVKAGVLVYGAGLVMLRDLGDNEVFKEVDEAMEAQSESRLGCNFNPR